MKTIEYSLVLSKRKTIAIYVKPDKTVEVRAPKRVAIRDVESFLQSKQAWITAKLADFDKLPDPHRLEFREGGTYYFLGEPHSIVEASSARASDQLSLDIDAGEAIIPIKGIQNASEEQIQKKLEQWHKKEALSLFTERHDYWRHQMAEYDLPTSYVAIRKMKRRWGSCTTQGKITFNTMLSKYPLACVDAVVVHELCHLLEFSHNKRFYQFLGAVYPSWKESDKLLQSLSWQY